jgi:hypothetical protein
LRSDAKFQRSHRGVDEASDPIALLHVIGAELPSMLSELGLVGQARIQTQSVQRCDTKVWDLRDLTSDTERATRACHALVMGTLLPEFGEASQFSRMQKTPAKLAWLAQAYVEADALEQASAAAVRTIAWEQLELVNSPSQIGSLVDVDDPVHNHWRVCSEREAA